MTPVTALFGDASGKFM